ncbi:quinone oxidoreductase [Flagelloscypha sp. PMI_526]|nr:quinone oxidoreductase [Flagelloscypha sp. PMI_526]
MKAILVKDGKGPVDNLYIGDADVPVPKNKEVLIKVKAFGINRMDLGQRLGIYPLPPGISTILGVEFSRIVESLGEGVTIYKSGDEVFGLTSGGAYAEYVTASEGTIMPKPPHLTWVEAACIPENYITAFQALVLIWGFHEGQDVLIHAGASGVGIAATQIARLLKGHSIIVAASSDEKLGALGAGPTHGINYKSQSFTNEVEKITQYKGVNVVLDFIGADYFQKNLQVLGIDGRLVLIGFLSGTKMCDFDLMPIGLKRLRVEGTMFRARSLAYQTDLVSRFAAEILPHLSGQQGPGFIHPVIHKQYAWKDIAKAHLEMESNSNIGKIVAVIE